MSCADRVCTSSTQAASYDENNATHTNPEVPYKEDRLSFCQQHRKGLNLVLFNVLLTTVNVFFYNMVICRWWVSGPWFAACCLCRHRGIVRCRNSLRFRGRESSDLRPRSSAGSYVSRNSKFHFGELVLIWCTNPKIYKPPLCCIFPQTQVYLRTDELLSKSSQPQASSMFVSTFFVQALLATVAFAIPTTKEHFAKRNTTSDVDTFLVSPIQVNPPQGNAPHVTTTDTAGVALFSTAVSPLNLMLRYR